MDIGISHCGELVYVAVIFFISVNFCFSFVLNSFKNSIDYHNQKQWKSKNELK